MKTLMHALARWFKRHLESVVFLGAVSSLAALVLWWALFARRLISENEAVSRSYLSSTVSNPSALEAQLDRLKLHSDRQRTMISMEGPTFGFLIFIGVGALFVLARARRKDQERMARLLQFTTHELKTPVAGVRALLQSFKLGSIPASETARFLDQGIGECNRLEHLAETILAYQRAVVQPKGEALNRSDALIGEILEHRSRTFGVEGVLWQRGPLVSLWADRDAFRVVVENLLDNARKYGGGTVELLESRLGNRWRLEVKDRGQGFSPDLAEQLFEPFSRHSTDGVSHGSGLGLYLSRQLAQQLSGTLTARSDGAGKGSSFVFELPCAAETAVPLSSAQRNADA